MSDFVRELQPIAWRSSGKIGLLGQKGALTIPNDLINPLRRL